MKNIKKIMLLTMLIVNNIPTSTAYITQPFRHCLYDYKKILHDLEQALRSGDNAQIKEIFANLSQNSFGKFILLQNALHTTPLNYDVIKLLLDNGANLYKKEIMHLLKADNADFVQFIQKHFIKIYKPDFSLKMEQIIKTKPLGFYVNWLTDAELIRIAIKYKSFNIIKTLAVKNRILHDFTKNLDLKVCELLLKYGAQPSAEDLRWVISWNNIQMVKLFLSTDPTLATDQVWSYVRQDCPAEIIKLLLEHGATIPPIKEQELLCHADLTNAILSPAITQLQDKIKKAPDLNKVQKNILLKALQQLNLIDIIKNKKYDSLKNISPLPIAEKLLLKYFPFGLWINQKHREFKQKQIPIQMSENSTNLDTEQHNKNMLLHIWNDFAKDLAEKKDLTVTEQLFINLASEYVTVGANALVSGKNINDSTNDNYYQAGFAGDLLKLKIIEQVCQVEKELHAQGFEIFFHGRSWRWNFANDIYKLICQVKSKNNHTDKINLRFRFPHTHDIAQLQKYRKDLIENGASFHFHTGTDKGEKEAEITCMNITSISNPGYYAECTGTYFIDNKSCGNENDMWEQIEKMFQENALNSWYQSHKKNVQELYNLHEKSNNFGELLCIAVKKEHLDTMVYPAKGGGIKVPGTASEHIKNCKQNALVHKDFHDKNRTFYCLAVSDISGEYDKKYTIRSLNLADPEKYAAYKQARDTFAAKLKDDLNTLKQG